MGQQKQNFSIIGLLIFIDSFVSLLKIIFYNSMIYYYNYKYNNKMIVVQQQQDKHQDNSEQQQKQIIYSSILHTMGEKVPSSFKIKKRKYIISTLHTLKE